MSTIRIPVQAWILDLYPASPLPSRPASGSRLQGLKNGLALPSFWSRQEITEAFAVANRIWSQANIEFTPVTIAERSETVPDDEQNMWIYFVNNLSARKGVAVGFVFDLPSNEGGWGGGRIAVIAGAKAIGAIEGYQGRILAHELGHILLGISHRDDDASNLMFGQRNPRVVTADLLDADQIRSARSAAQPL
jgi:hypothetical protein